MRAALAAISRRKGDTAKVLYTADTGALESDEIFVEFVTGSHDAFVIEDADHILDSRANGNLHLHRFLAIADGVVRAQGRKILFTTNLPNVGDIDDVLLRPGRCFANVRFRALERAEVERLTCQALRFGPGPAGARNRRGTAGRDQIRLARVHLPGGRRRARCSHRSGSGDKARRCGGELNSITGRPCAHAAPIRKPDRSGRSDRAGRADCARRWPPSP